MAAAKAAPAGAAPAPGQRLTPVRALLALCTLTFGVCILTTFSHAPVGVNSGPHGEACVGKPTAGYFCLCPRETVCATEWREVAFLALARCSAYFDYPLYVLLFISKCQNLRGMLYRTYLREWLPLDDVHHLHTLAGTIVGFEVISHSFWHMLRWGVGGDISFLWKHQTGITGLIALLVTPLIVFPMLFRRLRRSIPFGFRKSMHYLSAVWGVCLCAHAPATRVAWVMGITVGLYFLDWVTGFFFAIHYCPTLKMTRLGETAVEVVFEHPRGFINRGGGYVYICLPWLGRAEWHAFSLYLHPTLENHSSVCIAALGDWTRALHTALAKPSSRAGYVYGPFPSPFSGAVDHDNLMAVASGIGITPTLGAVAQLSQTRKVNVVWMCRQPALVEYFVRNCTFDDDAWSLIFYTGKRKLVLDRTQFDANPRLLIIKGRPKLREDLEHVMLAVESNSLLPASLLKRAADTASEIFDRGDAEDFKALLERGMCTYSLDDMYNIATKLSLRNLASVSAEAVKGIFSDMDTNNDGIISGAEARAYRERVKEQGVTFDGFCELIELLAEDLPSSPFDKDSAQRIFDQIDTDGGGSLSRDEFEQAIDVLAGVDKAGDAESGTAGLKVGGMLTRSVSVEKMSGGSQSVNTLLASDIDCIHYDAWQVLYCGGAAPVVDVLNGLHKDTGLAVKIESFDW